LQDEPVMEHQRALRPTRPQSMFQKAGDASSWRRLCSGTTCSWELERLEAERRKRAGAWLGCFPNANLGLKMKPQEFVVGVRYWLGLCGQTGFRALLNTGRDQIARHDAIWDVLYETAKTCGLSPGREVAVDGSNFRPGDLYIPNSVTGPKAGLSQQTLESHTPRKETHLCWRVVKRTRLCEQRRAQLRQNA